MMMRFHAKKDNACFHVGRKDTFHRLTRDAKQRRQLLLFDVLVNKKTHDYSKEVFMNEHLYKGMEDKLDALDDSTTWNTFWQAYLECCYPIRAMME
jgi:hypothetical protein